MKYEGQCTDSVPNGFGTFYYTNKDKYIGSVVNEMKSGNGTLFYSNQVFFVTIINFSFMVYSILIIQNLRL